MRKAWFVVNMCCLFGFVFLAAAKPVKPTPVDTAMNRFLYAVKTRNRSLALTFIPKSGLRSRNTIPGLTDQVYVAKYSDLVKDKQWVNYIIMGGVEDPGLG